MSARKVAVIGGGLGGMTAAAELARAGVQVTLFESTSALGGKARAAQQGGVMLDTGPTLLTLPDVVRATFERLGAPDLFPRLYPLELQCHYRFADGARLDAFADTERTAASAAALGPSEADGVRGFYRAAERIWRDAGEPYLEAPFEGFFDFMARVLARGPGAAARGMGLGTLAGLADTHFRTPHLRAFAGRFATYAGASPWKASAAFALIPHVERAFGVHHVEGGIGALVRALEAAVLRLGVRVVRGGTAGWTQRGSGFVAGPAGGEEAFDALVVNADPLRDLGREDEEVALSGYVLLLRASRRVALPHHLVLFSQDYRAEFAALDRGRLAEDPTVYVCHPSATDPTMSPEGQSGLFVMVNAPALGRGRDDGEDWATRTADVRAQALERLQARCPELRGVELEVLGERTPLDLAALGAPRGSIYGFLPSGRLGPFRRPRIRGPVPGLFYAGGGTHPGGGVPMVMMSGRFAAELATRHLEGTA